MGWKNKAETRDKFRNELYELQNGKCCYCEKKMNINVGKCQEKNIPYDMATFEHLMQKCEGGTNAQKNIKLACVHCNRNRPNHVDWMTYKSFKMGEISKREMYVLACEARYLTRDKNPIFEKEFSKMQMHFMPDLLKDAVDIRERVICG